MLSLDNKDYNTAIDQYYKLCSLLLDYGERLEYEGINDAWGNYILDFILQDDNVFSQNAAQYHLSELGDSIKEAVKSDLKHLEQLYRVDFDQLMGCIGYHGLPKWHDITKGNITWNNNRKKIKQEFDRIRGWDGLLGKLWRFYSDSGTGIFNKYKAFRWRRGALEGIDNVDDIMLDDLIGYQYQIDKVVDNTIKLLKGFKANNVLLYGDRGTGKSSTVKALVNQYCLEGLRLVEISKDDFIHLIDIVRILENNPVKFILFIDDLSFNEDEGEYRELKALLEGRIQPLPKNVVIYATSNRRHLIKEMFSDRKAQDNGEVRMQDTLQEKLSLADRFGITVIYTAPNQREYLDIVFGLARSNGINMDRQKLNQMAVQWEMSQNGRSGRTARQFIDYLKAEMGQ